MAREFEESTGGRPKIKISVREFRKLCELQCTQEECAAFFDVSMDTIERRCAEWFGSTFAEAFKRYSAGGRQSLRRKQFEVAMDGNVPMLIWLGKQMLGQKDVVAPAVHEFDIPVPTYQVTGRVKERA